LYYKKERRTGEMAMEIKANEIETGMVVRIYGETENVPVERVANKGYGAVEIFNGIRWYGLGEREQVTLAGHFNP
jgi:hypothetical protein